jgi:hypothetical protein
MREIGEIETALQAAMADVEQLGTSPLSAFPVSLEPTKANLLGMLSQDPRVKLTNPSPNSRKPKLSRERNLKRNENFKT